MFTASDAKWMAEAIKEAKRGIFSASPNPAVGCVIVDCEDKLLSKGFHAKAGTDHAEVVALKAAGFIPHSNQTSPESLVGSTVYVTLEPCSHTGRTPPCADALIQAKVARVIIASVDVNPVVHHQGLTKLKEAGIEVLTGLMAKESVALNTGFNHRMKFNKPWLTVKLAASLDGKTALLNGESQWITGEHARADVQRERALSCAILSGADTVINDNPRLNVRTDKLAEQDKLLFEARKSQPLRVIIDGKNRLDARYQIFNDQQPVLVFNASHNPLLESVYCQQIQVTKIHNFLDLTEVMQHLAKLEINRLWTEAGASLCGALFSQSLVNELILYQAPILLGDKARSTLDLPELMSLSEAIGGKFDEITQVGNDLKLRIRVKSTE